MVSFRNIWGNLLLNATGDVASYIQSQNWRWKRTLDSSDLEYRSRAAYKSVLVYNARRLTMATLEQELNDILPRYKRHFNKESLKKIRSQQEANYNTLVDKGKASTSGFGFIKLKTETGNYTLIAKTKYGTPVPEALILSFEDGEFHEYDDVIWDKDSVESYTIPEKKTLEKIWNPTNTVEHTAKNGEKVSINTKTIFHIDLAPQVSLSSTKNVVLTQVQGRDYTRKELVSGGDLTYSVSGNIVSNDMGVYPTEAVKRFVRIMQHGGIVDVNFVTFGILNVKRIIIKDWSLGQVTCKNIQPYSFTCVAVEPDDIIRLTKDTISVMNEKLALSPLDNWYKLIINNKLVEMGVQTALNVATNATVSSAGVGLDALMDGKI